jgi:hypothetical protein
MTKDEIIEIAKQAGLTSVDKKSPYLRDCLERFAKLVAEKERKWVELTDEEIQYCENLRNPEAIVEEVEAKLKEKNT